LVCVGNGLLATYLEASHHRLANWLIVFSVLLSVRKVLESPADPVHRNDLLVAFAIFPLLLLPQAEPSWLAMTAVAGYLFLGESHRSPLWAGAAIALAATVPLFWGALLPIFLSQPLESFDLYWVALSTGVHVSGNHLDYLHGTGGVMVTWGCTSFSNASLALLVWTAVTRTIRPVPRPGEWRSLVPALLCVFTINTVRLSLMAQNVRMYHLLHDADGSFWIGMLLLSTTVCCCLLELRHELAT
jgi:hypothetical protein